MKYKILTKEQIIISLDRLTRFKKTREKYLRVFADILVCNLIEPKLKKSDIENMDFSLIAEYVSEIFNESLKNMTPDRQESLICNNLLRDYENSIFNNDIETQKLLNNDIDYCRALELIPEDCPVNLKWLKHICDKDTKLSRERYLLKYPLEAVLLVEGITEEILLPVFAKFLGYDFYAKGVQIIAAGGKNQVVKMYYELSHDLKTPIFVLLDKDAEDNIKQIAPRLRAIDRIHLVSCGEFEDLLPRSLIIKTVNRHFKNFMTINESDLSEGGAMAKTLEEIFKTRGLHEFKKAEFAKLVSERVDSETDISPEIKSIIMEINNTNKTLDTESCSC